MNHTVGGSVHATENNFFSFFWLGLHLELEASEEKKGTVILFEGYLVRISIRLCMLHRFLSAGA